MRSSTHLNRTLGCLLICFLPGIATKSAEAQVVRLIPWNPASASPATRPTSQPAEPPVPLPPVVEGMEEALGIRAPIPIDDAEPLVGTEVLPQPPAAESDSISPLPSAGRRPPTCTCNSKGNWRTRMQAWKRQRQASHWGYPEYFCEPPLGASISAARELQIAEGIRDQLFLHHQDFYPDDTDQADRLTAYGELRLRRLAEKSMTHGLPLRIETTVGHPELDRARRQNVIDYCDTHDLGLPSDLILVGIQHRGIQAAEAIEIYRNQVEQTQSSGIQSTTAPTGETAGSGTATQPIE